MIIKDIYSVDVNDNSEHNVIDEIESVKYVDDYLQSAVNSQVIDRFDKQVIGKIHFCISIILTLSDPVGFCNFYKLNSLITGFLTINWCVFVNFISICINSNLKKKCFP